MTEKAPPTRTACPSRWRAPTTSRATAAAVAGRRRLHDPEVDAAAEKVLFPADEVQDRGRDDATIAASARTGRDGLS